MKNLANYISISRIFLSVFLLFTEPLSLGFFMILIVCGISDFFDGYVARTYGLKSNFGAVLDSFADVIFFFCFLISLLSVLNLSYFMILWIICIFLIKLISLVIGFIKFHKFTFIHTYLNKITGAYLILLPFILLLSKSNLILVILWVVATFAALEELIIIISDNDLNLNRKSIFKK